MNKVIKFRGMTWDGEWVLGDLIHLDTETLIAGKDMAAGQFKDGSIELEAVSVDPKSIGQFTGLTDKNGKEIYEGDIVRAWGGETKDCFWEVNLTGTIEFSNSASFDLVTKDGCHYSFGYSEFAGMEIIVDHHHLLC